MGNVMKVNPARAGMIPIDCAFVSSKHGKPRASGDDPLKTYYRTVVAE